MKIFFSHKCQFVESQITARIERIWWERSQIINLQHAKGNPKTLIKKTRGAGVGEKINDSTLYIQCGQLVITIQ